MGRNVPRRLRDVAAATKVSDNLRRDMQQLMMRRPLFVIGLARSGTNLLARMLDRHPAVAIALDPLMPVFRSLRNALMQSASEGVRARFKPESPFQDFYFDPDGPVMLDILLKGNAGVALAVEELSRLQREVPERAALESPQLAERLRVIEGATYAALIDSALGVIAAMKPAATWVGCKEVWVFDFIPLLARAFPDARFYAIERDPRAIVASLLAMGERDPTQAAHAPSYMRHWRKSVALWRTFEADPGLRSRFRRISYEELVADPGREAKRLCQELGLAYDPGMLALSAEGWPGNSSFAEGKDVYTSSTERWRTRLPAEVVRTTDLLCGPEMALTAYSPQFPPAVTEDVRSYLYQAENAPMSWSSTSGDVARDLGGESRRLQLLGGGAQTASADDIRRHFLFTQTFEAILRSRAEAKIS